MLGRLLSGVGAGAGGGGGLVWRFYYYGVCSGEYFPSHVATHEWWCEGGESREMRIERSKNREVNREAKDKIGKEREKERRS